MKPKIIAYASYIHMGLSYKNKKVVFLLNSLGGYDQYMCSLLISYYSQTELENEMKNGYKWKIKYL